ncbi:MAG TPA: FAD-dependent oxidoreductase [Actinomycetota bacterium]
MVNVRDRVQVVVVGAGIVGTSAAYHLAELGVTDVLVVDQGPLYGTGGSTSHAPGLVFQTDGSRTMCRLAQYTVKLYRSLDLDGEPCFYPVGGIEVATTPERMEELKRRQGFARSYGLEGSGLLTAGETVERIPLIDPSAVLGSYFVPTDGIAKAVRAANALARRAEARGVAFEGSVTVTGFDIREGRVRGVRTDRGDVACEQVLVCAGIWGPRLGRLAGVPIPLAVLQRQLVWTEPLPELASDAGEEVRHPILRHQDMSLCYRQRGDRYAIGNYRHEPILFEAGLGFVVRMDKDDFQGKAALEAKRERGMARRLACTVFDDPADVVMGKEPVWSDGRVVSYVTSANYGYSIGRGIAYCYVPTRLAVEGTLMDVEYFGRRVLATVTAEPLFDPRGERMKA